MDVQHRWIDETLSPTRFRPYLREADGDCATAIELYWWNVEVSAAFYPALHCLELALRNALHRQLVEKFGRSDWWEVAPLEDHHYALVGKAADKVRRQLRQRRPVTPDDLVAELSFGFWVWLVGKEYHRSLWEPWLHRAFPHRKQPRSALYRDLDEVRRFRNRIMHYEPIHHRHLEADHATILRLIRCVCPEVLVHLRRRDQVETILARRPELGGERR